jgi:hypothetical protein
MEETLLDVLPEDILGFFQHAMAIVEAISDHFVFNLDEMCHQDCADRTEKKRKKIMCRASMPWQQNTSIALFRAQAIESR